MPNYEPEKVQKAEVGPTFETHDECERWAENKRKERYIKPGQPEDVYSCIERCSLHGDIWECDKGSEVRGTFKPRKKDGWDNWGID